MSEQQPHGSETKHGPGWWIASDNRWYPPELHPDFGKPTPGISSVGSPSGTDSGADAAQSAVSTASAGGADLGDTTTTSATASGAGAAASSAALGGAITADSLSSSTSSPKIGSEPLPTVASVDPSAATTPPTYGGSGATSSLPSTEGLPGAAATRETARSVFSSDSATRSPSASAPKITTPPLTSSGPSTRGQTDKASFDFATPVATVEPTTNVPAGTTAIIAGLLSILGSFMLWATDTGSEIPDFLLVRRVAAFDSNGPFTLLIGVGLVIVGALLMFGQRPLWLWSVLAVLFGTIVLACVIWSYVDITGRASDDWAEYVAAATGTPESTVSALGVGLKTSLGLWITGFGGLLGVLTAPLARRGA